MVQWPTAKLAYQHCDPGHDACQVDPTMLATTSRHGVSHGGVGRPGEVAEWLKAPHSKCGVGASLSGVRIPPSPPQIEFQLATLGAYVPTMAWPPPGNTER